MTLHAYQGGICKGDNDVGVKVIQHGAFDGPDSGGVAWERRNSHFSDSQARPEQAQGAAGPPPTQGEHLRNLLIQHICHLHSRLRFLHYMRHLVM